MNIPEIPLRGQGFYVSVIMQAGMQKERHIQQDVLLECWNMCIISLSINRQSEEALCWYTVLGSLLVS